MIFAASLSVIKRCGSLQSELPAFVLVECCSQLHVRPFCSGARRRVLIKCGSSFSQPTLYWFLFDFICAGPFWIVVDAAVCIGVRAHGWYVGWANFYAILQVPAMSISLSFVVFWRNKNELNVKWGYMFYQQRFCVLCISLKMRIFIFSSSHVFIKAIFIWKLYQFLLFLNMSENVVKITVENYIDGV